MVARVCLLEWKETLEWLRPDYRHHFRAYVDFGDGWNANDSRFGYKNRYWDHLWLRKLFSLYPELGGKIELDATTGLDFAVMEQRHVRGSLEGTLTCKVVEVRPNGNLVVLGWKEVRSNKETQYLSLSGMVRPQDIKSDNTSRVI